MTNYRLKKLRNLNNEELEVRKYVLNNLYKGKKKTNIAYMVVTAILSVVMIVFMINVFEQSPQLLESPNHGTAAVEANNSEEVMNKIEELSTVWATALKTRDGEPRYEMMSEKAKEKFIQEQIIASGENWNYVIGDSSPWVVSFEIQIEGMTATITYDMRTSEVSNFNKTETIHFIEDEYGELVVDDYKSTEIIDNNSDQIEINVSDLVIPTREYILENGYPVNDKGETYGPDMGDLNLGELGVPDLMLAEGENGTIGYVKKVDLDGPTPKTPEEALKLNKTYPRKIPLYDVDGETIIGKFFR